MTLTINHKLNIWCHFLVIIGVLFLVSFLNASEDEGRNGISIPVPGGAGTMPLEPLVLTSFENWRKIMLKGSSGNGIPFLDPFVVPFDILLKFPNPLAQNLGYYELLLSKLTFAGLSTFKVKSLQVDPLSRDMTFENYVGNMSASSDYKLTYFLLNYIPVLKSDGSAYGAIYGADLKGMGTILPTPGNWFQLSRISMTFSFESLDVRIYPKIPIVDPSLQKNIQDNIYNQIQKMKPNMSELSTMTYSKTVELKLS